VVGREVTFPESFINGIKEKAGSEVVAEMVTIGGNTTLTLTDRVDWSIILV
jgi:hypothetical protein